MRSLAAAAVVLAVCAPRPVAQADVKQVLADFKAATKQAVKNCKDGLADLGADLQDDIDILELGFGDLATEDTPIDDFAAELAGYQDAAQLVVVDACTDIGDAAGLALAALTEGPAEEDVYPKGVVSGDGGLMQQALHQVEQAVAKANAAASKKLDKLAKKLRAKTDMRVDFVLRPQSVFHLAPISGGFNSSPDSSLAIDLVVAFNRGDANDDGRIWTSGFADANNGDVTVLVHGPANDSGTVTPAVFNGRWSFETSVLTDPLDEGSYLVLATQSSITYAAVDIGLL